MEKTFKPSDGSKDGVDPVDELRAISEELKHLALNASIEAARAGDQGRGFGVVAEAVQQVAERLKKLSEELSKHASPTHGAALDEEARKNLMMAKKLVEDAKKLAEFKEVLNKKMKELEAREEALKGR